MLRERTDCRCCRGVKLTEVFDLGQQPYANAFLTAEQLSQPEVTSPLTLMECAECGHVQLRHIADAADLYRDYSFQTSSSRCMVEHFSRLMDDSASRYVPVGGLVVEIGSNDGSALASLRGQPVRTLGVDPAENLAAMAEAKGVTTISTFFAELSAKQIRADHGPADLIVACNVLAHVDDLDNFCRGIDVLLSEDGALIVEVPYLIDMIDDIAFNQIYHEHYSYFCVSSLAALFNRNGFRIESVEHQDVHGGSIRSTIRRGSGFEGIRDYLDSEINQGESWLLAEKTSLPKNEE